MRIAVGIAIMRKAAARAFAVGSFFATASVTFGQDFYVKGEVEYSHYSEHYTREFELYVKGKAWQVVMERKLPDVLVPEQKPLPNGKATVPSPLADRNPGDVIAEDMWEYSIMGSDSLADHYHFYRRSGYWRPAPASTDPGRPAAPPSQGGQSVTQMITLYAGPVPWESNEKVLPYLWLAFGSGPYFASLKTNMVKPFYHSSSSRWYFHLGYQQEAKWRLADTLPRLPMEVTYLNPGTKLERERVNGVTTTNLVSVPYSPPYDKGFMNAQYRVMAQTNIGGLTLPTEFQFAEYSPAGNGSVDAVRTVRGRVHKLFSYCPKKKLELEFPPGITVRDERIRTDFDMRRSPAYFSSRLLTTNEAIALVQGNKNPPPAVAAGKLPPKPRPWWERVLAVVALGVPLGVVWWRFYRRGAGASAPPAK